MWVFMNHLTSAEIAGNIIYFVFNFEIFHEYIRIEYPSYINENIERKYLNKKDQILKVKNSLLELEKDFIELKNRIKTKRSKKQERQNSYF